ncbi:MAG: DUF4976 domain-containing protein [Candidatus Latescibacteria bacterium]|nr:DUF4976 domain-containing protein [Candidatus Latescibacterota bacterium]
MPSYLEGRSLRSYLEGDADCAPREWVFCEDNYQVMMRGQRHKMVYYIGQDQGELYDLEQDPHELWNLWDRPEHQALQNELTARLLRWMRATAASAAGSTQCAGRARTTRFYTGHGHGRCPVRLISKIRLRTRRADRRRPLDLFCQC